MSKNVDKKEATKKPTRQDAKIAELEAKIEELTNDAQRVQAEFANYRRREQEAKAELTDMAKESVVIELLPVIDNLERALKYSDSSTSSTPEGDANIAQGLQAISKQLTKALSDIGVTKIESLGQPFDHKLHEAISMEDGEGDEEVVVEELQPGYKIGDRVIRHAMVKVGRK